MKEISGWGWKAKAIWREREVEEKELDPKLKDILLKHGFKSDELDEQVAVPDEDAEEIEFDFTTAERYPDEHHLGEAAEEGFLTWLEEHRPAELAANDDPLENWMLMIDPDHEPRPLEL